LKIKELRSGMKKVDADVNVVEVSDPREVVTRYGESHRVATAVVSDDTGTIKLSLWDANIDEVKVGDKVKIENGYVTTFRNENQLNVGRFGKLTVVK
jgi:replication factor A1